MAGKPKPPEKRRDHMLRARVTAKQKARVKRVADTLEKDESDWLRDKIMDHVEAEEKRLGLPPISGVDIVAFTGGTLTVGQAKPYKTGRWPKTATRSEKESAPRKTAGAGTGSTSAHGVNDEPTIPGRMVPKQTPTTAARRVLREMLAKEAAAKEKRKP